MWLHTMAHTPTAVIELLQVSKTYTARTRTVQALLPTDLTVRKGEFVCLLGASGCGKSTLLNLVAGLETPTGGVLKANGAPITGPGIDRVMMFQDAALFPWLTVRDNVAFPLRQAGKSRRESEDIAGEWISRVHLSGFEHSAVHQLSGGMRQRVALARSLTINPEILLMDEPFGALDALTRDRLHHELETLWAATHKTILFVTHNVREAVALGDRVLVFSPRPGRVIGEFQIDLPRPRSLEDVAVVKKTAEVMDVLRGTLEPAPGELEGAFI
jgi:NitT/TauT family transport system ATP-binding protein